MVCVRSLVAGSAVLFLALPALPSPDARYFGAQSGLKSPIYRVFKSQSELQTFWKANGLVSDAKQKAPTINFKSHDALLIAAGRSFNSNGISAKVSRTKSGHMVRYNQMSYQTAGSAPNGGAVQCSPWGLVLVPKQAKGAKLRIEENVQGRIGEPPIWKLRKALTGR